MLNGPIAQKTIRTSAVFAIRLFVQAATLVVVAKMLGPTNFGLFSGLAALSVVIGAMSCLGLNVTFLAEVSKNSHQRSYVLSYAIPTTLLFSLTLLCVYFLLAYYLASGVSWQLILSLGVAEVVVQPFLALMVGEFVAQGRPALAQLFLLFPLALRLIAAFIILNCKLSEPLIYYGFACLTASLAGMLLLRTVVSGPLPHVRGWRLASWNELKQSAGYAAVSVSSLGPAELDKAIAVKLLPASEVGVYAAASRVVGASTLPVIALMLSALPRLFRFESEDAASARRLIWGVLFSVLVYGTLLAFCLFCAAPLLPKIFGVAFMGVESVIQLMCLAIPALAVRLASGNILMANNKAWWRFMLEVAGVAVFVLIAILTVSSLEVNGLIYSMIVAEWSMAAIGVGCVYKIACKR